MDVGETGDGDETLSLLKFEIQIRGHLGAMRVNETPSGVQTFSAELFVVSCIDIASCVARLRLCEADTKIGRKFIHVSCEELGPKYQRSAAEEGSTC